MFVGIISLFCTQVENKEKIVFLADKYQNEMVINLNQLISYSYSPSCTESKCDIWHNILFIYKIC